MASPDHAGSVARSAGGAASSATATAAASAKLDAGSISARLDRLPATRSIWKLVVLLSLGFFFELYDLLYSGYVAPGLVKSGLLTATTHGLFGSTGVASFIAALFSGLFIGTIACGFLADRFGRRAVFTYSLLWYSAANLDHGVSRNSDGFELLALRGGDRHRRRTGDDRHVHLRTGAQADSRPRFRLRTGRRFYGGAGGRVSLLSAGAAHAVRTRRLALGRADRRARCAVCLVRSGARCRKARVGSRSKGASPKPIA